MTLYQLSYSGNISFSFANIGQISYPTKYFPLILFKYKKENLDFNFYGSLFKAFREIYIELKRISLIARIVSYISTAFNRTIVIMSETPVFLPITETICIICAEHFFLIFYQKAVM